MLALFAERGGDPDRPGKQDPLDALLWRGRRDGEPTWDTAVGPGRPGWHIECSVIARNRLGMGFDVQGGGSDLRFPHHEHSAAHAEALTGEWPFARHYVHAGMIGLDGEKMSKSPRQPGVRLQVARRRVDPMAIRLALLDGHYRADREWTGGRLPAAEQRLATWRRAVAAPAGPNAAGVAGTRARPIGRRPGHQRRDRCGRPVGPHGRGAGAVPAGSGRTGVAGPHRGRAARRPAVGRSGDRQPLAGRGVPCCWTCSPPWCHRR